MKTGNVSQDLQSFLPSAYSQKGIHLKGLDAGDAWYGSTTDSVVESYVFGPNAVRRSTILVAMARVGDGCLGYAGDCNAEAESHLVVVAMCGLL